MTNELPRSKRGASEEHDENCPKGVIPEFFYRGVQFGIRLDSRLKHVDGLRKRIGLTQQAAGNWTAGIKLDSGSIHQAIDISQALDTLGSYQGIL